MKVLFAGTPEFARVSLEALLDTNIVPLAVLTQPDRAAGRGRKIVESPVKTLALARGIPVLQPATLKDPGVVAELGAFAADLIVVAAYGLLLPQSVLDLPRRGCLNVHASLLPRWRGAAPIQAAILAGDGETGISLMHMEAGLDTGPVYASQALRIGDTETAGELHDRLAVLGGELLVGQLESIVAGRVATMPQDDSRATYAGKFGSQDALLDWRQPAIMLARRVRAYNPAPGAWFELDGERIKCWSAVVCECPDGRPGEVISADKNGVTVVCGDDALCMQAFQRPGRKPIKAGELATQLDLVGARLD